MPKEEGSYKVEVDLNTNTIKHRGRTAKVTSEVADFVFAIMQKHPEPIHIEEMRTALWGHPDRHPENTESEISSLYGSARTIMWNLRTRLLRSGTYFSIHVSLTQAERLRRARRRPREIRRKLAEDTEAGNVYGGLTSIKCVARTKAYVGGVWLFQCKCGNKVELPISKVRAGKNTSCGCGTHKIEQWNASGAPYKPVDHTGKRYGKLTALRLNSTGNQQNAEWVTRCDCGKEYIVSSGNLQRNKVGCKSCATKHALSFRRDRPTKI